MNLQASVQQPARIILIWIVALCSTSAAFGQNLITNGDFENGYSSGWNHLQGNNGSSATFSEETADVHTGNKALKVIVNTLGSNAWDVQTLGPSVNLSVGEEYTLTYWAKAASAGKSIRIVIQGSIYTAKSQSLSTSWQQYSWTFTAQEANPQIRIHYYQTGTFLLDDIELLILPRRGRFRSISIPIHNIRRWSALVALCPGIPTGSMLEITPTTRHWNS
jgi:hypothetical protein